MKHYLLRLQEAITANWNAKALCNYHGEEFTYGQVAESVEKFKIFYETIGLKKGDKIAICAKNSARWGISFFSANAYEAVAVPILADFTPESINSLVAHSESKILFTDDDIFKKLDISKMPEIVAVVSCISFKLLYAASEQITSAMDGVSEAFAARYPLGFTAANVSFPLDNDKDIAVINYTSGTTSAPKGVMLRFECLSSNVDFGQTRLPAGPGCLILSMLPMAHMFGMMFEFIYPVCGGATVYYLGKTPSPSLLLKAMAEIHPIQIITVPLVMEKIYKSSIKPVVSKPAMKVLLAIPGISQILSKTIGKKVLTALGGNIRTIIMGGAALNPEAEHWFRKIGLPCTVGYGMTECAPLISYEPSPTYVSHSCGKCVEGCTVRIDSPDPLHEVGEIQIKGTNVMSGYYKNEAATAAAFTKDGYLRSGDLGLLDKDGNIFIKGRSKNMILSSSGQNIYPEEIEAMVNNYPYVIESVVIARDTKIVALVYLDKDGMTKAGLDPEAIDDYTTQLQNTVNNSLPGYSKIAKVEVRDEPFEKTPKMSIKRFLYV